MHIDKKLDGIKNVSLLWAHCNVDEMIKLLVSYAGVGFRKNVSISLKEKTQVARTVGPSPFYH